MRKIGKSSLVFENVYLKSAAVVTGPKEKDGPLGDYIDLSYEDLHCNQDNWEKAECQLLQNSLDLALLKADLSSKDLDLVVSGDLNNQIVVSNYVMRQYEVPFIGVYGACSTSCLSLITGSTFLDSGFGKMIACATSSHNATSERQFRYPTEYGGQKPVSLTTTVTASGAGIISTEKTSIKITRATIGQVVDSTLSDPLDMGNAMAPAAAITLKQHLIDFNLQPNYYDLILTGDLSQYGSETFKTIMEQFGYSLSNYNDCGLMVYDRKRQNCFAGGSGCGCAAMTMYGYIYQEMLAGKYQKVLMIATGALLNPIIVAQNETIPGIAHCVAIERN